jgi:hypothetical protein
MLLETFLVSMSLPPEIYVLKTWHLVAQLVV